MGCGSCAARAASASSGQLRKVFRAANKQKESNDPNCIYNNEILQIWADKLNWFKSKGKWVGRLPAAKLNRYLGVVLTSLNINNKCREKQTLDEIANWIPTITELQGV